MLTPTGIIAHVDRFVADFNKLVMRTSTDSSRPTRALYTGSASEYLSYIYKASLDEETINVKPVPTYVRPLHHVGETEIHKIMRHLRHDMRDSAAPSVFCTDTP